MAATNTNRMADVMIKQSKHRAWQYTCLLIKIKASKIDSSLFECHNYKKRGYLNIK